MNKSYQMRYTYDIRYTRYTIHIYIHALSAIAMHVRAACNYYIARGACAMPGNGNELRVITSDKVPPAAQNGHGHSPPHTCTQLALAMADRSMHAS